MYFEQGSLKDCDVGDKGVFSYKWKDAFFSDTEKYFELRVVLNLDYGLEFNKEKNCRFIAAFGAPWASVVKITVWSMAKENRQK